jgi:hypothetical protein
LPFTSIQFLRTHTGSGIIMGRQFTITTNPDGLRRSPNPIPLAM